MNVFIQPLIPECELFLLSVRPVLHLAIFSIAAVMLRDLKKIHVILELLYNNSEHAVGVYTSGTPIWVFI